MKNVFRWIGFLPAAVLAFFVVRFISVLFSRYSIRLFLFWDGESKLAELIVQVIASLTATAAFVFVGTLVAPSKNDVVSLCLSILVTIFCAISIGIIISGYNFTWQLLFEYIAMIVAAWVSYVQLKSEDLVRRQ